MSGSRAALFQAVLDAPGEDAPRLAYAAYCDAQRDPYGEFIREQLARTAALRAGDMGAATRAWKVAETLEAEHRGGAWTNGVERFVREPRFIRGFVDKALVDARSYLEHGSELFRRAPIRQLVLYNVGALIMDVVKDPKLAQLVALSIDIGPTIGDSGIAAIASSPHLRNLRSLVIPDQEITPTGLDALCSTVELRSLIFVNLTGNRFEDPVERYGTDWATGQLDLTGADLPQLGKALESRFGEIAWLHAPSRMPCYPPLDAYF